MAKDPAFLFYPNDFNGGTMGMSFEQKGAYLTLLILQHNRGHMTSHMIGQTIGQLWAEIKDKFLADNDGLFYNERLELEINKRKSFTKSRNNNLKGTNQHSKAQKEDSGHTTSHMENRNEDINTSSISFNRLSLNSENKNQKNGTEKNNIVLGKNDTQGKDISPFRSSPRRPYSDYIGQINLEGKVIG